MRNWSCERSQPRFSSTGFGSWKIKSVWIRFMDNRGELVCFLFINKDGRQSSQDLALMLLVLNGNQTWMSSGQTLEFLWEEQIIWLNNDHLVKEHCSYGLCKIDQEWHVTSAAGLVWVVMVNPVCPWKTSWTLNILIFYRRIPSQGYSVAYCGLLYEIKDVLIITFRKWFTSISPLNEFILHCRMLATV